MPADEVARQTLAAVRKGKREFVVARGQERLIVLLRRLVPGFAFDRMADAVAKGYAARMKTGSTGAQGAAADERS